MTRSLLALAAALAAVLWAAPLAAEPLTLTSSLVDDGYAKVRKHCDQHSRCWTEGYRNQLLEAYRLAPPPRYGLHNSYNAMSTRKGKLAKR